MDKIKQLKDCEEYVVREEVCFSIPVPPSALEKIYSDFDDAIIKGIRDLNFSHDASISLSKALEALGKIQPDSISLSERLKSIGICGVETEPIGSIIEKARSLQSSEENELVMLERMLKDAKRKNGNFLEIKNLERKINAMKFATRRKEKR